MEHYLYFIYVQIQKLTGVVAPLVTLTPQQRAEMERRKQFWARGRTATATAGAASPQASTSSQNTKTNSGNNWEAVKFTKDSGGTATASKFLRLMGAADAAADNAAADDDVDANDDEIVRRNQMFSTMERQFDAARAVTHKKKGQGFGSGAPKSTKKYF